MVSKAEKERLKEVRGKAIVEGQPVKAQQIQRAVKAVERNEQAK